LSLDNASDSYDRLEIEDRAAFTLFLLVYHCTHASPQCCGAVCAA